MSSTGTHTAKCLKCGRTRHFHSAEAADRAGPHGRICRMRIRAAQLAAILKGFTQAQIEAAREMIADGAFVPTGHPGVFRVVSSDGERTYLSHPDGCNCPAWLRRVMPKSCKHMLGSRILTA